MLLWQQQAKGYGIFDRLITTLKDKTWFIENLVKWLWYNSNDEEDENDYIVEGILYHYTKKESVAQWYGKKQYKALHFDLRNKSLSEHYSEKHSEDVYNKILYFL